MDYCTGNEKKKYKKNENGLKVKLHFGENLDTS